MSILGAKSLVPKKVQTIYIYRRHDQSHNPLLRMRARGKIGGGGGGRGSLLPGVHRDLTDVAGQSLLLKFSCYWLTPSSRNLSMYQGRGGKICLLHMITRATWRANQTLPLAPPFDR